MEYEVVIGLEVHVQLATESKIFCSCSTDFESKPNTNICPVCCGYPGVLPVLNRRAVELAVRVSLALNCKINKRVYFERKNYFYPDLPKNYQISQYELPLAQNGYIILPSLKKIGIERAHLEEDAGKLVHKGNYSLVDLNRTGIPLLEIVSRPDIRSADEAFDYLNYLKLTIQYIGASSCDMEKGYLRCDANISVRRKGGDILGTKVELKNMNSFRGVRDALLYEAKRQIKCLDEGKKIYQETRLWDEKLQKTQIMRTKEEAHDYRYFPEPDLPDFVINDDLIDKERTFIKELPIDKRARFIKDYSLGGREVDVFISNPALADFFEKTVEEFNQPRQVANWILGPLLELINSLGGGLSKVKITPANFSKVVKYFTEGKLNNLTAKKVLSLSIEDDRDIDAIIKEEGLLQVSGEDELLSFVDEAIKSSPKAVEDYLKGRGQAVMFIVGQVMKKTKGKANPKVVKQLIEGRLKEHG